MLEITFLKFLRLVKWKNKWKRTEGHTFLSSLFSDFPSPFINSQYSNIHKSTAADLKYPLLST